MTTLPPTTPAPTTVGPTLFSPDLVPATEDVVLPTACITRLSPTQVQNCMHIEWELSWPSGASPDPEEIRQYIERSQHPNGPFRRVGIVPGPRTFFVDVSVDHGTFASTWYYRIKCRRVRR